VVIPKVGVLGGGSFGLGLASAATRIGREVILCTREPERDLPEPLRRAATSSFDSLRDAELIFIASPSAYVRDVASRLGTHLDGSHLLVHVSRGLADPGLTTLTQVLREVTPCRRVGALAGPLVAESLQSDMPGGAIVGTLFPEVANAVRQAIAGPTLHIEHSSDVLGVELASALVGVLSVAVGYAQETGLGPSALAVMVTQGMREGAEIGASLGAERATFAGLAGMADLIAAVAPDGRPEIALGRALAGGGTIRDAAESAGAHIEGVTMAQRICAYASKWGLETPILSTLSRVFEGSLTPEGAVSELMAQPAVRR
jgi:glycerol-3-phosphate dehydrogenase (NAD(P)+)